jgi:hypothetical protein
VFWAALFLVFEFLAQGTLLAVLHRVAGALDRVVFRLNLEAGNAGQGRAMG